MCNDNNDEKLKTRSQYAADNLLYILNLNISRISWSAATSMYQDSIVLHIFLTDCASCDKYNKNIQI